MADISPKDLRERCEKRLGGMKTQRMGWEPHWQDIATFEQPMRGRWLNKDHSKGDSFNNKLLNGKAMEVIEILANGFSSGMNSPAKQWFKLKPGDPDMADYKPVKEWINQVEERLRALFQSTNFYTAAQSGYVELALFGLEGAIMTQHWRERAVVTPLTAGEFWIGLGDSLSPDSLYRRCPMTVAMAVQKFGKAVSQKVMTAYDQSNYDQWVPIFHAIEPNPERIPGRIDKTNMVYRSVYWEDGCKDPGKEVLAFDGFEQQPFWAPRWDASGATPLYSKGPGSKLLVTAKQLEIKELRLQQLIDYAGGPPLIGPPQMTSLNLNPRAVNAAAMNDIAQLKPIFEIEPAAITAVEQDIARLELKAERYGYVDLFKAITNMEGIQPRNDTEIGQRIEEKMTQLGPVVLRVEKEKLSVAIEIAFSILLKTGQLPPAPQELSGQELKVEFVGVLSQAQRAVGLGAIQNTAGFALNLMRADPTAGDKVNFDKMIEDFAEISGTSPEEIRSDDEVAAIRAARAKQQQLAAMAQMAPAAKDAAGAVKASSEAAQVQQSTGFTPGAGAGSTVLESLLGGKAA